MEPNGICLQLCEETRNKRIVNLNYHIKKVQLDQADGMSKIIHIQLYGVTIVLKIHVVFSSNQRDIIWTINVSYQLLLLPLSCTDDTTQAFLMNYRFTYIRRG